MFAAAFAAAFFVFRRWFCLVLFAKKRDYARTILGAQVGLAGIA